MGNSHACMCGEVVCIYSLYSVNREKIKICLPVIAINNSLLSDNPMLFLVTCMSTNQLLPHTG